MKQLFYLFLAVLSCSAAMGQPNLPAIDKSPIDISYYPNNYPVLKIQDKATGPLAARVVYSRPKKEGRTIFGGLVEYGKVWRLGANEATEIEFYQKVNIGGKKVSKGRYTLYAIVNENSWTFIVNKETDTWGSFKYSPDKDVVRVDVPAEKITELVEYLAMTFEKTAAGINLVVAWENTRASLPITL
ncbi:MAG TPA: DUF2911 domain-containing protein [Chitinophagaceae bacterium]|nr:DUF2911 domain-containing protein [Chitinophagaceae bacterium]